MTADFMPTPLGHVRAMVAKVQQLMAARCDVEHLRKLARAAQTDFRKEIDEGVHAAGREQLAMPAEMPF